MGIYCRGIGATPSPNQIPEGREIRGAEVAILPERVPDRQQQQEIETTELQHLTPSEQMDLPPPIAAVLMFQGSCSGPRLSAGHLRD